MYKKVNFPPVAKSPLKLPKLPKTKPPSLRSYVTNFSFSMYLVSHHTSLSSKSCKAYMLPAHLHASVDQYTFLLHRSYHEAYPLPKPSHHVWMLTIAPWLQILWPLNMSMYFIFTVPCVTAMKRIYKWRNTFQLMKGVNYSILSKFLVRHRWHTKMKMQK